jgi:hypothetical protein
MRTSRRAALGMMLLTSSVVPGLPLVGAKAQDAPGVLSAKGKALAREDALKTARERVMELEKTLATLRDELDRENRRVRFTPDELIDFTKAGLAKATEARKDAELAITEYEDGIYPQDLENAKAEIESARTDLKRAEQRHKDAEERFRKFGDGPLDGVISLSLVKEKARFAVEQAETKLKVLTLFTKDKTLKQLRAEVDTARADERAWEGRLTRAREAQRQTKNRAEPARARAPSGEELAVLLMDDAVARETRASAILGEIKELAARLARTAPGKEAKDLAEKVDAKRAEVKKLSTTAQSLMNEALALSQAVVASWTKIRDVEQELAAARADLAAAEKLGEPRAPRP